MRKEKDRVTIRADDDDFGAVLNCAVRYCIGRRTYMPKLVTDWIREHCSGILNRKTVNVMKYDIDHPLAGDLGDSCDRKVWMDFRAWLETGAGQGDDPDD